MKKLLLLVLTLPFLMTGCGKSITQAEKVNVRLEPWTNPKGKQIKMLYINWKNVGNTPIRVLSADMTFYDASGNVVDNIQDCAIYACWKGETGIAPGESYIVPTGKGFFVHDPSVSTAKAEIKTPNHAEHLIRRLVERGD